MASDVGRRGAEKADHENNGFRYRAILFLESRVNTTDRRTQTQG